MSDVLVVAPIHEDAIQLMRNSGLAVTDARGKPPAEIRELLKSHRALLGRAGVKIDDELLAEASQLRIVAVGSVGMDSLDLPYLYSRGLKVSSAAGGNRSTRWRQSTGSGTASSERRTIGVLIAPGNSRMCLKRLSTGTRCYTRWTSSKPACTTRIAWRLTHCRRGRNSWPAR
jgi:hypothetical protein